MTMTREVEVDSEKECSYRFLHRDIEGVMIDGQKFCPACIEAATIE